MAQAIGSYSAAQTAGAKSGSLLGGSDQGSTSSSAASLATAVNVGGMVGALKQFDTNGNVLTATGLAQGVSTVPSLTPPSIQNLANNGVLTTGK